MEKTKKTIILKELGLKGYLTEYRKNHIINAYKRNRPFALIDLLMIDKEADDLINKGYTVDEIIKTVMKWMQERLNEIEKEKERENRKNKK